MILLWRGKWRLRHGAERRLANDHAARHDFLVERGILFGIDHVDATAHDRERAGLERAVMGRRVDATRHAGDNREAGGAQIRGQLAGEADAVGRGVARPHHGDDIAFE